jgi:hypothetical protein
VSAIVKRPASTKSKSSKMLQVGIKGTGQLRRTALSLFAVLGGCREAGFSGRSSMCSHKYRSYKFSNHRFYYNFTEIIIITLLLTRILDCLIGGGISLYSNSV